MSLHIGIIGLPNVGKSTLFKALTKKAVSISNYPFTTIDPNIGVVAVPDDRLEAISKVTKSNKVTPTTIEFVDIAGLVKNAHQGEGLGNQFLSHIREVDAIVQVVRAFQDPDVTHVAGAVDPKRDVETVNLELVFADLATVSKRHHELTKKSKAGVDRELRLQLDALRRLKSALETGKPVRSVQLSQEGQATIKDLNLLTQKPVLYVLNVSEQEINTKPSIMLDGTVISLSAKIESELAELSPEDSAPFMAELGMKESGLSKLIRASYQTLDLITFFTATGSQEVRAWAVKRGTKAPQAAGVIHTDFEKGFIRAEVTSWKDFVEAGGEDKARDLGKVRIEGKDYVMQDGDVAHFHFQA